MPVMACTPLITQRTPLPNTHVRRCYHTMPGTACTPSQAKIKISQIQGDASKRVTVFNDGPVTLGTPVEFYGSALVLEFGAPYGTSQIVKSPPSFSNG